MVRILLYLKKTFILKYFREEFDKIDLSESSNLLSQLVYATDTRKVRFFFPIIFIYQHIINF